MNAPNSTPFEVTKHINFFAVAHLVFGHHLAAGTAGRSLQKVALLATYHGQSHHRLPGMLGRGGE